MEVVAHVRGDVDAVVEGIRRAVAELDPVQPITRAATLDELVDESLAQPRFNMVLLSALGACALLLAAVGIYGIVSYGVMVLMMSVTPLAMEICGFAFKDAAFVIQWHVLGMYVPSFFTGHLIRRFGTLVMMQAGGILLLVAALIAAAGISLTHFWAALILLGLGWNFLFTASTTLLTETYTVAERAKAQGVNEMMIFGVTGLGVFLSGALLHDVGWTAVALAGMPPVMLATILAFRLARRRLHFATIK